MFENGLPRVSYRRPIGAGELLFFLHIPKTAGTSLYTLLTEHFQPDEIAPISDEFTWYNRDEKLDVGPYRVMRAHHDLSLQEKIDKHLVTVTMLRDPVQRVISQFNHSSTHDDAYDYERIRNMSFEEFLEYDSPVLQCWNQQARMVAGALTGNWDNGDRYKGGEVLERAKLNLKSFAFVGLCERMSDSMRVLSYTFNWPDARPIWVNKRIAERKNLTDQLSPRLLDKVREMNRLDVELYQYAQDLLNERLQEIRTYDNLDGLRYSCDIMFEDAIHRIKHLKPSVPRR